MKAIDIAVGCLGGVGKLAAAIGVSQAAVSNWRARGSSPDAIHCTAIERATGGAVTRRDLRPDDWVQIWPELAESEPNQASTLAGTAQAAIKPVAGAALAAPHISKS